MEVGESHGERASGLEFQRDAIAVKGGELTGKAFAALDGLLELKLDFAAKKPLKVPGAQERTVDAGTADLEGVSAAGDKILCIESLAGQTGDRFAVVVGDALRLVDEEPEDAVFAAAKQLSIDQFQPEGGEELVDEIP